MGEVYTAHDPELNRSVALKVLSSEFSDDKTRKSRFRQEARAASALNHPNIITIYEIGENEFGSFLVTELIDGKTLREIIKSEPLSVVRTLKIIEQTANALVAAHNAHIAHRDIKPENIMVRHDGIAKVLDFGLAKPNPQKANEEAGDDDETVKTIPGVVMGSARYMSPEQARGVSTDERTDIWSLGVVLYEMLTGRAPFDGTSTGDTIAAVIYKEPEPLLNIVHNAPAELQRIVRKSLQKDREARYQSIKDFALDVKDLLYELEHDSSAERIHTTSAEFDRSENPTIIHQTSSSNNPTKVNGISTGNITYSAVQSGAIEQPKSRPRWAIPAVIGLIVLLTVLGFAGYRWLNTKTNLIDTAFEKPQVSRLNSDGKVFLPAISPDGKYIAYASGESGNRSLVVRQLSTDSTVTIVPPTNLDFRTINFSPQGDYIYYCQTRSDYAVNTLYQIPTLGGTPKKLIEDVDSSVTFSPDGKQFAFMRHTSNTNEDIFFIVDTNTLNTQQLISTKETDYDFFTGRPDWSPDGKRILLSTGKRRGGFITEMKVAEISVAEKKLRIFPTREFVSVGSFCWFKDGSGFLFAGRETQNSPAQIWTSTYPGGEFHPVTNDSNDYTELGLSSDGNTIITLKGESVSSLWRFSPATKESVQLIPESRNFEASNGMAQSVDGKLIYTRSEGKKTDFWQAEADGKNQRPLTADNGYIFNPVLTPDGRYIVFNSQNGKTSKIWRMNIDGKNPIALTEQNPDTAEFNPQILPDGKTVIFQRNDPNADRSSLMKVSVDGGEAVSFYSDQKLGISQPRISPDGKRIAFGAYHVDTFAKKMIIASLNGNSMGAVEKDLDFSLINQFYWSADSKSLTISSNQEGVANLFRLPLDGSPRQPITDFKSGRIFNFSMSNDNKSLFIVRGIVNNDLILIRNSNANAKS